MTSRLDAIKQELADGREFPRMMLPVEWVRELVAVVEIAREDAKRGCTSKMANALAELEKDA